MRGTRFFTRAIGGFDAVGAWLRDRQRSLTLHSRPSAAGRLAPIESRVWSSDLGVSGPVFDAVQAAKHVKAAGECAAIHWKGVPLMKDPFSLACYPLVIQELRPRTVIEIGSFSGGSALWLADLLGIFGLGETCVHSFDIDVNRVAVSDPRIVFHPADARNPATFDCDLLRSLPHPWLVIEDAHVNVYELLRYLDSFISVGDQVVVEDTISWGYYVPVDRFLRDSRGRYLVDTQYTDVFGYNATWHLNGYLRKVRD